MSRSSLFALALTLVLGLPLAAVAPARAAATVPGAAPTPADATVTPLDKYLDNLRTLRTTFLQTLADPHGREIDRASGTLIVQRPGKFSWDIRPQPVAGDAAVVLARVSSWFVTE